MSVQSNIDARDVQPSGTGVEQKLAAIGWGLFFLWVGIALLAGVPTGVGLLVVGAITLGMQAVRKTFGLALEGFWIVVGGLFALGGLGALLEVDVPMLPLVLVAAGLLLLVSALGRKG